ncbi:MAG: esterase family protein [Chloroflexota bacterium]
MQFDSRILEGNPLGDPTARRVGVYLPPGYDQTDRRYTSVYMLSAFAYRGIKLLNDSLWDENIQERMDRLITENKIKPMVMVLPDASTRYGGSQYVNSSATGQYEDHILELVTFIDEKYRTVTNSNARAVAGHSSGGYGATMLGMKHPDVFGMVADHSGDKYFELVFQPEFGDFLRYYERVGDDGIYALLADPGGSLRKGAPFAALNIAAMASCYSPNPETMFGFDIPFDLATGEMRADVWERWRSFDPVNLVDKYADNLQSLNVLFFDCGQYDEYNLLFGSRQFANKLKQNGIPFQFEEDDDGQRNVAYRYDVSLAARSEAPA